MASSAVSDLYWPIRRRLGYVVDQGAASSTPRLAVAITGLVLIGFAVISALRYDPAQRSLLNFALGVMSFAYTGMLGVFLTALLTRRGNTASVLLALLTGVIVTTLLQDGIYQQWTKVLLGHPHTLATFWWMPIGTIAAFAVCVAGSTKHKGVVAF
jgi:Na+/proline symporter